MRLVVPPAPDRALIDRLPDLVAAGRLHVALGLMKLQTGRIPVQLQEVEDFSAGFLRILDMGFIGDVQDGQVQRRSPVGHQPLILPVVEPQVAEIESLKVAAREVLEIARQAGIQRIPAAMDDPRTCEQPGNQAKPLEIVGHLVGHPRSTLRACEKALQVAPAGRREPRAVQHRIARARLGIPKGQAQVFRDAPHIPQLAGGLDLGMAGEDLLDQAGPRTRRADNEDRQVRWQFRSRLRPRQSREPLGAEEGNDPVRLVGHALGVVVRPPQGVSGREMIEGSIVVSEVVAEISERELQAALGVLRCGPGSLDAFEQTDRLFLLAGLPREFAVEGDHRVGEGSRVGEGQNDLARLLAPALTVQHARLAGQGRRMGRLILQDRVIVLQRFFEVLLLDHDDGKIDTGLHELGLGCQRHANFCDSVFQLVLLEQGKPEAVVRFGIVRVQR